MKNLKSPDFWVFASTALSFIGLSILAIGYWLSKPTLINIGIALCLPLLCILAIVLLVGIPYVMFLNLKERRNKK